MEKVDSQSPLASKMSSAALRKIKKPIIEKRRRERINDSLNQLKSLVLDAMQKDESRYSKMEKADILEMTVHHLKDCHRQQAAQPDNQTLNSKYTAGYSECANEVAKFLNTLDCLSPELRMRVMQHLSQGIQKSAQRSAQAAGIQTPTPILATAGYHAAVSQGMMPVSTLPCATQIATLPGSSQAQYPAAMSPLGLLTSGSMTSGVIYLAPSQISPASDYSMTSLHSSPSPSPAYSPSSSPAHSPASVSGAIPLYVSPSDERYSPVSQYASRNSTSPNLGDDVPRRYESHSINYAIAKTNNNNNNDNNTINRNEVFSTCMNPVRMGFHMDHSAAIKESMWRPW